MATTPECFADSDCPAPLLCYANVSWSDVEAFCGCSSWYGHAGADCKEFNANFYILISINVVVGLVALVCSVFGIIDIVRTVRLQGPWIPLTASNTTMLLCTAGMICQTMWMLVFSLEVALVDTYTIFVGPDRVSTVTIFNRSIIVLVEVFAFLSSLNVSVMWIELSRSARSMSPKMVQNVSRYRRVCFVVGAVFTLLMMLAMLLGYAGLGALIAIPFLFVLAVVFLVGRIRMVGLLDEAISRSKESRPQQGGFAPSGSHPTTIPTTSATESSREGRREKTAEERTRRTRRAIKTCSVRVIVALYSIVLSGVAYYAVITLPKGGWHEISPVGKVSGPALTGQLLPISVLGLLLSVFLYSHRITNKLLRRARGQASQSASSRSSKVAENHDHTEVGSSFHGRSSTRVANSFVALGDGEQSLLEQQLSTSVGSLEARDRLEL
mmetsp:Transcript_6929/g.19482  ORF Transcript_6929/g.19482 Transcript_6929/m.19482 type:complete len:440 (-) Transcript_6929:235-1554(-)